MRDVPVLKLAGVMLVLTVITSVIMLIPNWNGTQGSTAADDIDRLLEVSIVLSSLVFSVVMVLLGYAIWRWRAKPGDESDGEPIHGNTRLEIAWTALPTLIVAFLGAISWIVLDDIEAKEPDRMPLQVTAQQFAWEFEYPEAGKTTREFHVPVDRQLDIELRALDVLHSFWVPEWRIKRDLVPGSPGASIDDDVVVEPDREGTFTLVCTELCGLGHSTMRVEVVVESEEDFNAWLAEQPDTQPEEAEPTGSPES
jgi:cytochrome c oxidase subunit II